MSYKLFTQDLNKIIEVEKWINLDKVTIITKRWREGYLILREFPAFPEDYSQQIGLDVNQEFEPLHHAFKGAETRYEYINVNQDEQDLIEKIYSDSMGEGLEQLDWKNIRFECRFFGALQIEELK